ncbi:unnamed protein product [Litomosoides sigmodontis]|uniref:Uncharacterized protein n=1 Tax=Litomosoides sigmodontis TaxID=42156 RepID=A0A3P7M957_LITSI|nr:unnamed protein product [Litomosoides sigmodontis]
MLLELWNKGVLWDKLLGVHYLTLTSVQYSNEAGPGKWLQIDQELEIRNGQTVGTCRPTGHSILVDVRFELPYGVGKGEMLTDAQDGANVEELQAKLQELSHLMDIGVRF